MTCLFAKLPRCRFTHSLNSLNTLSHAPQRRTPPAFFVRRRALLLRMAAVGTTAADFGNTRRSKELLSRTRIDVGAEKDVKGSGPTPAAAAFLASLRTELLPLRPPQPAPVAAARPKLSTAVPQSSNATADLQPSAEQPSRDRGRHGKRFMSTADRRREKKRKRDSAVQQNEPKRVGDLGPPPKRR